MIALAALAALVYLAFGSSLPVVGGEGGRLVEAEFASSANVNTKTPVRVAGVEVGKVDSVELDPEANASVVTMRITDDEIDLRADASASQRFRTLLGGRVEIALKPGSPLAPALGERSIPIENTSVQTELDDVLSVFDGSTPANVRSLIRQFGAALDGNDASRAVDAFTPALGELGSAMEAVRGERRDDLDSLVASTAKTLRGLDAGPDSLGSLVSGAEGTFGTTAAAREPLGAALEAAPAAMSATIRASEAIDSTLPKLDLLVDDLLPGARLLEPAARVTSPALRELDGTLRDAEPLLDRLAPAVESLGTASTPGRELVTELEPTVRTVDEELIPYLNTRDEDLGLRVFEMIAPTFSALGSMAAEFDGIGHVFHFPLIAGENSAAFLPCSVMLTDPTAEQKIRCAQLNELLDLIFTGQLGPPAGGTP